MAAVGNVLTEASKAAQGTAGTIIDNPCAVASKFFGGGVRSFVAENKPFFAPLMVATLFGTAYLTYLLFSRYYPATKSDVKPQKEVPDEETVNLPEMDSNIEEAIKLISFEDAGGIMFSLPSGYKILPSMKNGVHAYYCYSLPNNVKLSFSPIKAQGFNTLENIQENLQIKDRISKKNISTHQINGFLVLCSRMQGGASCFDRYFLVNGEFYYQLQLTYQQSETKIQDREEIKAILSSLVFSEVDQ